MYHLGSGDTLHRYLFGNKPGPISLFMCHCMQEGRDMQYDAHLFFGIEHDARHEATAAADLDIIPPVVARRNRRYQ